MINIKYKNKKYVFSEAEILIFENDILIKSIKFEDIEWMDYKYKSYKIGYFFGTIFDVLTLQATTPYGKSLNIIVVKERFGGIYELGKIKYKDAMKIKELYGRLLTIEC